MNFLSPYPAFAMGKIVGQTDSLVLVRKAVENKNFDFKQAAHH